MVNLFRDILINSKNVLLNRFIFVIGIQVCAHCHRINLRIFIHKEVTFSQIFWYQMNVVLFRIE